MPSLRPPLERLLRSKYPSLPLSPGPDPALLAVFPGPPEVGDLQIWTEDDRITLNFGRINHTHYPLVPTPVTDAVAAKTAEEVVGFLEALFSGRVVFWTRTDGGTGLMEVDELPRDLPAEDGTFYTWAGRYRPPGRNP